VFERLVRDAGRVVKERGGYKLHECFIDATFTKSKGGEDGVGVTKAGTFPEEGWGGGRVPADATTG